METTIYALTALVILCVVGMGAALIMLIRAQGSIKDRELMCKTLGKFADRLVTEKDQQIERMKMDAQIEIGSDYMEAQREIEKARARHGRGPAARLPDPDAVSVSMDE